MSAKRIQVAAVVALSALLAAGCGGSTSGAGSSGAGAKVVPASAAALVSVNTDLSSSQWQAVDDLLAKFPAKDQLLTRLQSSFEQSSKLSWENDVKPALGPELDVVYLPSGGSNYVIGLTQPADQAKFDALVQKGNAQDTSGKPLLTKQVQGWTAFSDSQAALDSFAQAAAAGPSLADDNTYQAATGELAGDALATAYANGTAIAAALTKSMPQLTTPLGDKLAWLGADLVASSSGLKLDVHVKRQGTTTGQAPYTPMLVDEIPAGALLVADFQAASLPLGGGAGSLQGVLPSLPAQAGAAAGALGQLSNVLGGETALYVLPGSPLPEVTLVTHPADTQQALAELTTLAAAAGGAGSTTTVAGVTVHTVPLGRVSLSYGVLGGRLVVSDSQQAFSELQASGNKLADDATFKEAQSASGMPGQVSGFLYVNLKDSIPVVEGLAQLGGSQVPGMVTDNLAPLRTLTAWGANDAGGEASGTVALEIQ